MTESSNTPETNSDLPVSHHHFASSHCEPAGLIGDHWLEMTATLPLDRTENFAAWMDRELAIAERELAEFASPRSSVSDR